MVVNTPLETSSINSGWAGVASRQTFDEAGERAERDAVETSQGRSGDTVGARDLVHVMTLMRSTASISKSRQRRTGCAIGTTDVLQRASAKTVGSYLGFRGWVRQEI